jgi:enoyl-CoA hydratase
MVATMNRPEVKNAINVDLHHALTELAANLAFDRDTRCVILTGAGVAFSAGGDLKWMDQITHDAEARWRALDEARRLAHYMMTCSVPIIAAVNGAAVGLGASMAALSDLVLMSDNAYFADPHVRLGIAAGDGTAIAWPFQTSMLRVKEFLFTGDRITPTVAERIGLANRVVPAANLMQEASALAKRLSDIPQDSLRATKQALNQYLQRAAVGTLDYLCAAESEHYTLPPFRERALRGMKQ